MRLSNEQWMNETRDALDLGFERRGCVSIKNPRLLQTLCSLVSRLSIDIPIRLCGQKKNSLRGAPWVDSL